MRYPICIGHRGAMGHEPQNTLRSIRKALEMGVDAIEIDVYPIEGRLVVFHDRVLELSTNGSGEVMKQTFDYLRTLNAGKGEQIPVLEEVLDVINRSVLLDIEMKYPGSAELTVPLMQRYIREKGWTYDDFFVSSFFHEEVAKAKSLDPKIAIAPILYGLPVDFADYVKKLGASRVVLSFETTTESFVQAAHQLGIEVHVYTTNRPEEIAEMRRIGVDGLVTNFPERVIASSKIQ